MPGLLVHEWIEASGGAENVLEAMAAAFPDAHIQSLWNDAPHRFENREVRETWISRTWLRRHKALAAPATAVVWRRLRAEPRPDWMLVSSHLFAHHAKVLGADVPKFVYAHTPARYIWEPALDERGRSVPVRIAAPFFKRLDRARSAEAVDVAANSEFVRERIRDTWQRDAKVIYPPVSVEKILSNKEWRHGVVDDAELRLLEGLPPQFVMGASRFIPYKRLDLVIAAGEAAGLPVVIAGSGPEEERLRAVAAAAAVPVYFVISPSDALMYSLMQAASVFVFPPVEDFGILPVEAQATGTPIVTGPFGGQVETYISGVSGITAESTDPVHLAQAVEDAIGLSKFDPQTVTARFSDARFISEIRRFVR